MKFNILKKRQFMEWNEYKKKVTAMEDFVWRQSARRTFLP